MNKKHLTCILISVLLIAVVAAIYFSKSERGISIDNNNSATAKPGTPTQNTKDVPTPFPQKSPWDKNLPKVEFEDQNDRWFAALENSPYAMDQLLFAILIKNEHLREKHLLAAYALAPDNTVINYQIMQHCFRFPNSSLCSIPYAETLLANNPENGWMAISVATALYNNQEIDAAYSTLLLAANSASANDLKVEYYSAIDESFLRFGEKRNWIKLVDMIGLVAAFVDTSTKQVHLMCTQQGASQWQSACVQASLNMVEQGRTWETKLFGIGIAKQYLGTDNEEEQARLQAGRLLFEEETTKVVSLYESVVSLYQERDRESQATSIDEKAVVELDIAISDTQWQTYLDIIQKNGEVAAFEYLANQYLQP